MAYSLYQHFLQGLLLPTNDIGKAVEMQPLNLFDYPYDMSSTRIGQSVDPSRTLQDIYEMHCRALAQSVCNYLICFARIFMTVYLSAPFYPADETYASADSHVGCVKALKYNCHTVMLDGRYRRCLMELVRYADHLAWFKKPLHKRY